MSAGAGKTYVNAGEDLKVIQTYYQVSFEMIPTESVKIQHKYWLKWDVRSAYGPEWVYARVDSTKFKKFEDIPFIIRQMLNPTTEETLKLWKIQTEFKEELVKH